MSTNFGKYENAKTWSQWSVEELYPENFVLKLLTWQKGG